MRASWLAFLIVGLMAFTVPALADPIGGPYPCTSGGSSDPDSGSCFGVIYTLSYLGTPDSTTATTETFTITLTLDTTGYNGGGSYLNAVAIKVTPESNIVAATLTSVPAGFSTTPVVGGLGANGCADSSGGFICSEYFDNTGVAVPNGVLTFVFQVEVLTGTLNTDLLGSSVKALYVTGETDKKGNPVSRGLTSADITLQKVPEPGTMALFGTGLLGIAGAIRRKFGV